MAEALIALAPARRVEETPTRAVPFRQIASSQELTLIQQFTEKFPAMIRDYLPYRYDDLHERIRSLAVDFESPRNRTGDGANPYFMNTQHFYDGVVAEINLIPELSGNLELRKNCLGMTYDLNVDLAVQNRKISKEDGERLKEQNRLKLEQVKTWDDYENYRNWANATLRQIGSGFVFPSAVSMLSILSSGTPPVSGIKGAVERATAGFVREEMEAVLDEKDEMGKEGKEGEGLEAGERMLNKPVGFWKK